MYFDSYGDLGATVARFFYNVIGLFPFLTLSVFNFCEDQALHAGHVKDRAKDGVR